MRRGTGHRDPNAADDAATAARQKRRDEAWRLRTVEGWTIERIAAHLGVSYGAAQGDIAKSREEHRPPDLEILRAKVDAEVQLALDGLRRAVKSGLPVAIMAQMKALDRLCKLHGLDAPERKEVSGELRVAADVTPDAARRAMQDVFGGNVLPQAEPGQPGGGQGGSGEGSPAA